MSETDRRLRELLDETAPASVRGLPESVRADLAGVVADARRRQSAGLAAAFEATLKHVPFPVRSVVKKVLM
jgi:hypothetical protein